MTFQVGHIFRSFCYCKLVMFQIVTWKLHNNNMMIDQQIWEAKSSTLYILVYFRNKLPKITAGSTKYKCVNLLWSHIQLDWFWLFGCVAKINLLWCLLNRIFSRICVDFVGGSNYQEYLCETANYLFLKTKKETFSLGKRTICWKYSAKVKK